MSGVVGVVAFAVLAAVGTAIRVTLSDRANRASRPIGTLAVNLAGSLLAGLALGLDDPWFTAVAMGGAGALTTFSTFIGELATLRSDANAGLAVAYGATTLAACTALAWLGLQLAC